MNYYVYIKTNNGSDYMRTKQILRNTLAETIPYIILGIVGIIKVRFLIMGLGSEVNGYFQFINRIIMYLFIVEAGFSGAVIFKLYKPFADQNIEKVTELFNGARKIFRIIGFLIAGLILVMTIAIPLFFDISVHYTLPVMLSFLIIAGAYLLPYFGKSFTYFTLLCADQKKYVHALIFNGLKIVCDILIIIAVIVTGNIVAIAVVILIIKIIEEIIFRIVCRRIYPYLKMTKKQDTTPAKMTKDIVWHQFGFLISNNMPVVIGFYFLGPIAVSILTTYLFISMFLNEFTSRINNIVSFSFGNMFAKKETKKTYKTYDEYFILSAFVAIVVALTFVLGIRPFVGIWIGKPEYIINYTTVILMGTTLFLWTIYSPLVAVIVANGLYKESKWFIFISTFISLVVSVSLINTIGIAALFIGAVIGIIVNLVLRAWLVRKMVLPKLSLKTKLFEYATYTVIFMALCVALQPIEAYLTNINNPILTIIAIGGVFIISIIVTFAIMYFTKHNTKALIKRFSLLIKQRKKVA